MGLQEILYPEGVGELVSRRFDMLAKSKKQKLEQVVHITWERSSIYFDTIKISRKRADGKVNPGQTGLAVSPMEKRLP